MSASGAGSSTDVPIIDVDSDTCVVDSSLHVGRLGLRPKAKAINTQSSSSCRQGGHSKKERDDMVCFSKPPDAGTATQELFKWAEAFVQMLISTCVPPTLSKPGFMRFGKLAL